MHGRTPSRLGFAALFLGLISVVAGCTARTPLPDSPGPGPDRVEILDSVLQERISYLESASPSFAEAMHRVRASGVRVLIGTPEQIAVRLPDHRFDPVVGLATAFVLASKQSPSVVQSFVVIVESDRMRALYETYVWDPSIYRTDLALVLAHELYAHVDHGVRTRNAHDLCPDAPKDRRQKLSCSVQRENEIRRDLGLLDREDYRRTGLSFEDVNFLILHQQYLRAGLTREQARLQLIRAVHAYHEEVHHP